MKDEVMKAIEENRLYDFIANNYYRMSKEELKDVLLEVIWNCNEDGIMNLSIANSLSERWED